MTKDKRTINKLLLAVILLSAFNLVSCTREEEEIVFECTEPIISKPVFCESSENTLPFPGNLPVIAIHVYTAVNPECNFEPGAMDVCEVRGNGLDADYILFLEGHDPIVWDLKELVENSKKEDQGEIKGILISGYHCQELLNAPTDIPIKYISREDGANDEYFGLSNAPGYKWTSPLGNTTQETDAYIDSCVQAHTGNRLSTIFRMYFENDIEWSGEGY